MTSEQWRQVNQICGAALELSPDLRAAFLTEACNGDNDVLREVEVLLDSFDSQFLEQPAIEKATEQLFKRQLAFGQTISHYKVLEKIGAGGMGEVYRARDISLGRLVALKVLLPEFCFDAERVQRFQLEARAASALNHPNILTIHQIGAWEDSHFIASEFVEGETLRDRLKSESLSLDETLEISIQIGSALQAAHASGIVHRDIKPENVMIRKDGLVKVLDFGLAKLTKTKSLDAAAETRAQVKTQSGMIIGTAAYMSPEQARGNAVDVRTDVWSLGVVLYEMVTKTHPFPGETTSDAIAAILKSEAPPLAQYIADVPPELEQIVGKSLKKDREERYQHSKDMLVDLKDLKHDLEFAVKLKDFTAPETFAEQTTEKQPAGETKRLSNAQTDATETQTTSPVEFLTTKLTRHKSATIAAGLALFAALSGLGFGFYKLFTRNRAAIGSTVPFRNAKVSRLTTTGNVRTACLSPDGKFVAYLLEENGRESLWTRQVAADNNVQIVPPDEFKYQGTTFSPDGEYIYYVVEGNKNPNGTLYQVPVLGGTPRLLLTNIQSPIAVAPDGKQIAFLRLDANQGTDQLMLANSDGTGERSLTIRKGDEWFEYGGATEPGPAWSPDGSVIVNGGGNTNFGRLPSSVIAVQVKDGTQTDITSEKWDRVSRLAWLKDGDGLIATAFEEDGGSCQLWHVTYPGGAVQKITDDYHWYIQPSLSADSKNMVVTQFDQRANIWIAPNGDASRARQITTSNTAGGRQGLAWLLDGRIVYHITSSRDLWSMEKDGSNQKQLTAQAGINSQPTVTADGRYIVFVSNRVGYANIWRMELDGRNPTQLTRGHSDVSPTCSPDSRWVIYSNSDSGKTTLWKISIDGGEPVQLTDKYSELAAVSPDGKFIACFYWNEQRDTPKQIAVLPFDGGIPVKLFTAPQYNLLLKPIRWTPDGRAITYIDKHGGVSNLWRQPLGGGPAQQLTDFKTDETFSYDWSRDGQLAISRGAWVSDAVMFSDSHLTRK
jgi:serine/threonine protein kinase/Tol biopolymer transport system component